ncbi:MAG: hypothetical protein C5B57_08935 [Blastocatellia bacterium]|nr:MAG: hypothetical protein C5B57_08935 [Blastocatellia bacterium]
MERLIVVLAFTGASVAGTVSATGQVSTDSGIVGEVRRALATGDYFQAERILRSYRSDHGTTPDVLEGLSWLARGALAAKKLDKADDYATETYNLTVASLRTASLADRHLRDALVSAIDTEALVLTQQDARSNAVIFVRDAIERYRETPIHEQLEATLRAVSLEGRPAPKLDGGEHLGPRVPNVDQLKGKVVLLFFWAHWCPDCKAESPLIAKVAEKYRSRGLVIFGPTQRYGYVADGRPAPPDKELRYIASVRDSHYQFLRQEAVPVGQGVHRAYGIASFPVIVLIDREGIVRLYHPGRMTEDELEAAVSGLM